MGAILEIGNNVKKYV